LGTLSECRGEVQRRRLSQPHRVKGTTPDAPVGYPGFGYAGVLDRRRFRSFLAWMALPVSKVWIPGGPSVTPSGLRCFGVLQQAVNPTGQDRSRHHEQQGPLASGSRTASAPERPLTPAHRPGSYTDASVDDGLEASGDGLARYQHPEVHAQRRRARRPPVCDCRRASPALPWTAPILASEVR